MNMVKLNSPAMKKYLLAFEAREGSRCQPVSISFLSLCISFLSRSGLLKQSDPDHPCFSIAQHRFRIIMNQQYACLPHAKLQCKTVLQNCRVRLLYPSFFPSFLYLFVCPSIHHTLSPRHEAQTVLSSSLYEVLSKQLAYQQQRVLTPML